MTNEGSLPIPHVNIITIYGRVGLPLLYFHPTESACSCCRSVCGPVAWCQHRSVLPLRDILAVISFSFARAKHDDGGGSGHIRSGDGRLCINGEQVNAAGSCYAERGIKEERARGRERDIMLLMDDETWGWQLSVSLTRKTHCRKCASRCCEVQTVAFTPLVSLPFFGQSVMSHVTFGFISFFQERTAYYSYNTCE